jgi:MFS family permease
MPRIAGPATDTSVLSDAEHAKQLRRAVIASTIGNSVELYDFFIYGTATGLVFARLFFPRSDPLVGTLEAFSIWAVGFVSRPIGAVIFGHWGDRAGRKSALIATLMLMGVGTFLVGLVPTYSRIGIWGAAILTVLRFIQGIGVGGVWGGSVLLSMEWARTNKHRGFIASWPQLGTPLGLFLSNVVLLLISHTTGKQFLSWGWRIPFLLSIVLVGIAVWIRLRIPETPVFRRLLEERRVERAPLNEVFRLQSREVLVSALARMADQAPFYIFTAFVFSYGANLHVGRNLLLFSVLSAACVSFVTIPLAGHLSDRFGRKRLYLIGAVATAVFSWIYFAMLNTRVPLWIFLGIVVSLIPHDILYGPQAALIAESFTSRLRYSGASIGYQLASVVAGGPAPLIATALLAKYHAWAAISLYITACTVVSLIATAMMKDHTDQDISAEYDMPAA